jgi:hypothetical protein
MDESGMVAVPARQQFAREVAALCVLSGGWTGMWTVYSVYAFLCSRLPAPDPGAVNFPGGAGYWGPGYLSVVLAFGMVLALPLAAVLLVVLLVVGLRRLRQLPGRRWKWMAGWAGSTTAGFALEVAWVFDLGAPDPYGDVGRVVMNWSKLIEAGLFLAAGAAMIGTLIAAGYAVGRTAAPVPGPAVPRRLPGLRGRRGPWATSARGGFGWGRAGGPPPGPRVVPG